MEKYYKFRFNRIKIKTEKQERNEIVKPLKIIVLNFEFRTLIKQSMYYSIVCWLIKIGILVNSIFR